MRAFVESGLRDSWYAKLDELCLARGYEILKYTPGVRRRIAPSAPTSVPLHESI